MSSEDSGPAIELVGLSKSYGVHRAIDGVTLSIERGEIFGYLGRNGAGKTTTLLILAGLIRPSGGDARVLGRSVLRDPVEVKRRIGYVPESGAVFEKLTPRESLSTMGGLHGLSGRALAEKVDELVDAFGLGEVADHRLDTFSKGMKQKVCIASAIVHDPEVLLLDEPLNGLDIESVVAVKELLRRHSSRGRTVLYTSHLVDVVEKICTRIAVLAVGRLMTLGTAEELRVATGAGTLEEALVRTWNVPRPAV
ncbi:MAG: ABC transporter ATP-binding protein [Deltaproteobacteria bacterium]|nr:ABC transporter ATP-binding protein [Deltaproteobacteria bacterium]